MCVSWRLVSRHKAGTSALHRHMQTTPTYANMRDAHTYTGCYKHILFMHEFCAKMSPRLKEKQKQIGMSAHMQTYIQLYIHIYLHILYTYVCFLARELWNVRHHMLKLISVFLFYLRHFECAAPLNLAFFWLNYQSVKESARAADRERAHMTVCMCVCMAVRERQNYPRRSLTLPLSLRLSTCHVPKRVGWVEERATFIGVRTGCACCFCDCRDANSN